MHMIGEKNRTKERKESTNENINSPFQCPVCNILSPLTFRPARLAFRNCGQKPLRYLTCGYTTLLLPVSLFFLFFFNGHVTMSRFIFQLRLDTSEI